MSKYMLKNFSVLPLKLYQYVIGISMRCTLLPEIELMDVTILFFGSTPQKISWGRLIVSDCSTGEGVKKAIIFLGFPAVIQVEGPYDIQKDR
jgi:hypothetical protein